MQTSPGATEAPPAASVRAAVLGPVEVLLDGVAVDLGTPKQRALIAALTLSRGRPVSVDLIIDLLWGDDPPPGVSATLQAYVSQLRRVLEPRRERRAPATVLVTVAPGYALRVVPEQIDAVAFESAVTGAERLLQPVGVTGAPPVPADELARAVATLDGALALWRGEPYSELGDASSAVAERARLEELRLTALESRAVAGLALGHHGTVAAELEALTAAHPLRERLWALRAVALTRAGRQAEALEVLRRVREVLDEELGLEPSLELRDLQTAVLRQDPALDWVAPPAPVVVPAQRPDAVVEVVSGPAPSARPAAPVQVAPWPLVGRDADLAELTTVLERALTGVPSYAVLTGEPGIGKSRLAAEVAARARAQGVRVLRGRGSQDDGAPPLWVWGSVLEGLGRAIPEAAGDDAGAAFRVWEQICSDVLSAATSGPVMLLLDDLHWADPSSLRVLRLLLESEAAGARLMVLATWRPHPAPTGVLADVAETLARLHAVRLELTGLAEDSVADVFAAVAGQPLSARQARELRGRTEGNPFFLVEYARLAGARADLDSLLSGESTPTAVTEVLGRRLARLPADSVAALRTASVIGRAFDLETLAAATGRDEDTLLDAIEPALAVGLVREDGIDRYLFAHALVRDTLRADMSASRLARAHLTVARVLEGRPGRETEVARHWLRAGPWYAAQAWRSAVTAAEVARRMHAYDEAAALLRDALSAMADDTGSTAQDRYDVLMLLIDAYRWAAQLPLLVEAVEQAIDVGKELYSPEAVARAAMSTTQSVLWRSAPPGEVNEKVVGALRGSLDRLPAGDGALRCRTMLALANELYERSAFQERTALIEEARAMALRLGDDGLLLDCCTVGFVALWLPDTAQQRLEWGTEAMDLARRTGNERAYVVAATLRAVVLGELGRPAEMREAAEVARAEAKRLRIGFGETVLHGLEVPWLAMAGRLDECEQRFAQLRALGRRMAHNNIEEALAACLLAVRLWQGRALEVVPTLQAWDSHLFPLTASIAVYLWRAGEVDRARAFVAEHPVSLEHHNDVSLLGWAHGAELALYLHDALLGADAYALLAPLAGRCACGGSSLAIGPVDAYLAMAAAAAGEREVAGRHADDAARLAVEWEIPLFGAWFAGLRDDYGF